MHLFTVFLLFFANKHTEKRGVSKNKKGAQPRSCHYFHTDALHHKAQSKHVLTA